MLLLLFVQENFEASDRQKVLDVITSPGVVPVGSEGYRMMSGGFTYILYFYPYPGKWFNLTNILKNGLKPPTGMEF